MKKFFFLSMIALLLTNCKWCNPHTNGPVEPQSVCGSDYTQISDDSCVCFPPNFEWYGYCKKLRPNEYIGIMDGCLCPDTLRLWIYHTNLDSSILISGNTYTDGIQGNLPGASTSRWVPVETPEGTFYKGNLWNCQYDPLLIRRTLAYFPDSSTMIVDIYYQLINNDDNPIIDSCRAVFKR